MKQYNKEKPLIAIHVPKTGGTSFRKALEQWFGQKLYLHYYDEIKGAKPKKARLKHLFSNRFRVGICIYGHFNKTRGIGVKSFYPEVDQFITVLRDPFEQAISSYFHLKTTNIDIWKDKSRFQVGDLDNYLKTSKYTFLNQFPFEMTMDNYKDLLRTQFIHIGITEDMNTSVNIIAKKLGFLVPEDIEILNTTERTQKVPYDLKQTFMKSHQLEYAVYNFAKSNYDKFSIS